MRHIRLLFEKLVLPLQEKGAVEVVIDVCAKADGVYDAELVNKIQEAVKSLKIESAHFEELGDMNYPTYPQNSLNWENRKS
jgi:hypothetical protein